MSLKRKEERIPIDLNSSIKEINDVRRSFCIIRNISSKGVFLTAKVRLFVGQTVECIMTFGDQRITFIGVIRRTLADGDAGTMGYGIEITEINDENAQVLDEFVNAGYLPAVEEE